jgi:hypothetical protein
LNSHLFDIDEWDNNSQVIRSVSTSQANEIPSDVSHPKHHRTFAGAKLAREFSVYRFLFFEPEKNEKMRLDECNEVI